MAYLFWAFALVWLAFFAYNAYLVKKTAHLEQEIQQLENLVGERADVWKSHEAIDPQSQQQKATVS